ncbi:MAG: methylase [Aeromicrobium sp.]|nr:methylase [Aeromicrobium sp.]
MAVALSPHELDHLVRRLRAAGCVFAEDEAALIAATASTSAHVEELLVQRCEGRPLEHVLGFAELRGVRVALARGVFVPRQRSALLVDEALAVTLPGATVVDLCCGSGALGMIVLGAVPDIQLWAADVEPAAVRCARSNLEALGAHVVEGDLFDPMPEALVGRVDTIIVNAPYVPTDAIATMPPEARDHEPLVALDGGGDGVDLHRRIARQASRWLAPSGHLLIETSDRQAQLTAQAVASGGLHPRVVRDDEIDATVVIGTRITAGSPTG